MGSLVKETKIEDWNVFTCINCKMDTHALHVVKKYDRVLISQEMEVKNIPLYFILKYSCSLFRVHVVSKPGLFWDHLKPTSLHIKSKVPSFTFFSLSVNKQVM